jgi:hypothetical protein
MMPDLFPGLKDSFTETLIPGGSPRLAKFFKAFLAVVAGAGSGAMAARNLGDPLIRWTCYVLVLVGCLGGLLTDQPAVVLGPDSKPYVKKKRAGWALLAFAVLLAMVSDAVVLVAGFCHFASVQLDSPKGLASDVGLACSPASQQGPLAHLWVATQALSPDNLQSPQWYRSNIAFRVRKGTGVKWLAIEDIEVTAEAFEPQTPSPATSGAGAAPVCAPAPWGRISPETDFAFELSQFNSGRPISPALFTRDNNPVSWQPGRFVVDDDFDVPLTVSLFSAQPQWCKVSVAIRVKSDLGLTQLIPLTKEPLVVRFYPASPPLPAPAPAPPPARFEAPRP